MKRMTSRRSVIGAFGLAVTIMVAALPAQEREQADPQRKTDRTQQKETDRTQQKAASYQVTDKDLACWLIVDNAVEVQLSKFAAQQTQNDQVKQFAEKVAMDHKAFITKLEEIDPDAKKFGKESGAGILEQITQNEGESTTPKRAGQNDRPRNQNQATAQNDNQRDQAGRISRGYRPGQGQGVDMGQLKLELARKNLASSKEMLQSHGADHFDEAYVGTMIVTHQCMIDSLEVFGNHASSPEFRKILDEGLASVEAHLAEAKQLIHQVGDKSESGAKNKADKTIKTDKPEETKKIQ